MAEFGGYMYASVAPLAPIYKRPQPTTTNSESSTVEATAENSHSLPREKKTPRDKTLTRSNSTSQATSKSKSTKAAHHRFRHGRTSSSSSTSRSSHETALHITTSTPPSHGHGHSHSHSHSHHYTHSHNYTHQQQQQQQQQQKPSQPQKQQHHYLQKKPPADHASSRRKSSFSRKQSLPSPTGSPTTPKQPTSPLNELFSVPYYLHPPGELPVYTTTSTATTKLGTPAVPPQPPKTNFSAAELKHVAMLSDAEGPRARVNPGAAASSSLGRTESLSSASLSTTRTMTSSDPSSSVADGARPFVQRNGRTYLGDPTIPYPLPVDLTELHRQSLRTLLLIQVFGGPICSPHLATRPPARVLEVGCGAGFWSMMCHRYFAQRGHSSISFTGLDVAPLAPGAAPFSSSSSSDPAHNKPDRDMRWKFVQHDMRQTPWPFGDGEFDLVMVKDLSLATTIQQFQSMMDEYLRVLRPGGTLEIWESDHHLRMLRPHVPETTSDNADEHDAATSLGAYLMTANTPLSAPLNNFLVEYNAWLHRALEARDLSPVPCTNIGPQLLQESDGLTDVRSRRLAIPLSEVRWEREGVGGVVTKDGKGYIDTKGKSKGRAGGEGIRKNLTAGQAALRRTAMLTVVQLVQSLEPMLREVSGKSQDEWDGWMGKMMNDLMKENGTSWGECLEVGAWWARRKPPPKGR